MNNNQRFTPKYWVFHDIQSDDVFLNTAAKSLDESKQLASVLRSKAFEKYEFYGDCSPYQFVLVEIGIVQEGDY